VKLAAIRRLFPITDRYAYLKHASHLIEGLQERGYRIISPVASWEERSGIVTFDHEEHDSAGLHRRLTEARVSVSHSGKPHSPGLRVAPHFYNTEEEIEQLLGTLP
jgi:cysteine desulfurase/selenocysteine lyase